MESFDNIAITDAAIEQVEENADSAWKEYAFDTVEHCARTKSEFTALDFWARFREVHGEFADTGTHHLCAAGAVFRRAAHAGLIRKTNVYRNGPSGGYGTPGHTKALPIWESLVYEPTGGR